MSILIDGSSVAPNLNFKFITLINYSTIKSISWFWSVKSNFASVYGGHFNSSYVRTEHCTVQWTLQPCHCVNCVEDKLSYHFHIWSTVSPLRIYLVRDVTDQFLARTQEDGRGNFLLSIVTFNWKPNQSNVSISGDPQLFHPYFLITILMTSFPELGASNSHEFANFQRERSSCQKGLWPT